ncbi:MAG: MBL fold metallo-hydrolase [Porticoccaceae bacterium]|nr:MBL fold metallo-hydrolase [Porticoccaceae bacterium]
MKNIFLIFGMLAPLLSFAHSIEDAPDPLKLDGLMKAFGWDMDNAEIRHEKIDDGISVLFGLGGNIGVSIGDDGVFIIDDQFPQLMPKIEKVIAGLGGGDIDFAVTTHWHFDHAEGNLALGPEGTWLVAHENSREMMKGDHLINLVMVSYEQRAYPKSAWPDITFSDSMQFHLNGQTIDLWHFGPAHTTGDTAVYFRESNVVHLGDIYNNAGYPFIDSGNGGSLDGMINFCSEVLQRINKNTIVIPGHGNVADYQALVDYNAMLKLVRKRIVALMAEGATLDQVYAANPTADFDEKFGSNIGFINRSYHSLKK